MTASLVLKWFVPHKHIQYKHPWWWLLQFDPCPGILDDVKCDSINVQASLMMIVAIWSVCKYPWWWLWGFDPCPSILDDYYWDFIHVQASLMIDYCNLIHVQTPLILLIGILSVFKHTWWWRGFDQCTSNTSNSNCHRDQFLVTVTIPIVIVTKFLSRWQKIGHATKNKKNRKKGPKSNLSLSGPEFFLSWVFKF